MFMKRIILTAAAGIFLFLSCVTLTQQQKPEQTKQPATKPLKTVEEARPASAESTESGLSPERRKELELRARTAPPELKTSIAAVAHYLNEACKTDEERAWSIFVWISENIAYDTESFFYGRTKPQNGGSVLKSGMAVCAGYSDIFSSLADIIGLETVAIHGHGKGYSYTEGAELSRNHAWTGAKVENRWMLIDSTWGAGYVGDDREFHKKFDEHWFDVDPEVMIFTHLPDDPSFQFTKKEWTPSEYLNLPQLKASVFTNGFTPELVHSILEKYPARLNDASDGIEKLTEAGFPIEQISEELLSPDFSGFVKTYKPPKERKLQAVNLPAGAFLDRNQEYRFEYRIGDCLRYAIIYNGEWHFALREGEEKYNFSGYYDGTIDSGGLVIFNLNLIDAGSMKIVAQPEEGDSFGSFLEYQVR